MKKIFYLIVATLIIVANSCSYAIGTALVTGIQKSATDPQSVVLYSETPNCEYEVIGIVTASSDACCPSYYDKANSEKVRSAAMDDL